MKQNIKCNKMNQTDETNQMHIYIYTYIDIKYFLRYNLFIFSHFIGFKWDYSPSQRLITYFLGEKVGENSHYIKNP